MHYPSWGIVGMKTTTTHTRDTIIPYVKGLCKSTKGMYGMKTYFRVNRIIKNILVSPRTRTQYNNKMVSYTGIDLTGLTVMTSTLGNLLEHLRKETRNTSKHPPPYMATKTSLVMKPPIGNFSIVKREGHGFI